MDEPSLQDSLEGHGGNQGEEAENVPLSEQKER
jgi:hypothetical protein